MNLPKEEMAESNKFTHHILNVEAQTHTQIKTLDPRPLLRDTTQSHYEL